MDKGVLLVLSDVVDTARHQEVDRWYGKVHLPSASRAPGVVRAQRFTNARPQMGPAQYLTFYELRAGDIAKAAKALGGATAKAAPPKPDGEREVGRHLYRWIDPKAYQPMGEVDYPSRGGPGLASRPKPGGWTPLVKTLPHAVYLVMSNCKDPAREEEFNRWYSQVHVPDLTPAKGVVGGERYRNVDPSNAPSTYVAVYEFAHPDLAASMADFQRLGTWTAERRIIDVMQTVGMHLFLEVDALA